MINRPVSKRDTKTYKIVAERGGNVPIIPTLGTLRQKDCLEFEANLNNIVRACLKKGGWDTSSALEDLPGWEIR